MDEPVASRVVLSVPADATERTRERLAEDYFRTYLRRTRETAAEGETWQEFTDVGCCGSQRHVPLRVERVEVGTGGDGRSVSAAAVGPETAVEFEERAACGLPDAWSVQNETAPVGREDW